jgi:hypothetical protein
VTPYSLRWHYPDQVLGVDEFNRRTHPLSRNFSSPNGRMAGSVDMLPPPVRAVNAPPPPVSRRARRTQADTEQTFDRAFP